MNAQRTIFGLFILLAFIVPAATAQVAYAGSCCEWGRVSLQDELGCIGSCGPDTQCTQLPGDSHDCQCLTSSEEGCHYDEEMERCEGSCSEGGECTEVEPGYCTCEETDECRWSGDGCEGTCSQGGECIQDGDSYSCSCSGTPECVPEGQSYPITYTAAPPECCSGLEPIGCSAPDSEGFCGEPCVGAMVCAQCGNGICGAGENICNCPTDCTTTSVPEFATGAVALIVMLLSPAFAYLVVRRRH